MQVVLYLLTLIIWGAGSFISPHFNNQVNCPFITTGAVEPVQPLPLTPDHAPVSVVLWSFPGVCDPRASPPDRSPPGRPGSRGSLGGSASRWTEEGHMAVNSVHWFRKGLRLHDNPALQEALSGAGTVRCVYILDPWFAGAANVGINRWRFVNSRWNQPWTLLGCRHMFESDPVKRRGFEARASAPRQLADASLASSQGPWVELEI